MPHYAGRVTGARASGNATGNIGFRRKFNELRSHGMRKGMELQKSRDSKRPERRYLRFTFILLGCCVGVAILGIFIGIIIFYGGSQALQPAGIAR